MLSRLTIAILAIIGSSDVYADGLTPAETIAQGQCYASGSSGPRVPCVLQGQTWTRLLRPTDDASGLMTAGLGQVARSFANRLDDTFNVRDFGAIGDGNNHPLSQRYASLAAAQSVYPFVTSLSEESDWAAAQLAVNTACGHGRGRVWWPSGSYVHLGTLRQPCSAIDLAGDGQGSTVILRVGDFGPTIRVAANFHRILNRAAWTARAGARIRYGASTTRRAASTAPGTGAPFQKA